MTVSLTPERPVAVLDEAECWALLGTEQLGRLGYRLVDEIHVVPVNFGVRDGAILVRTTAGNKLLAAELEYEVGFEIDGFTDAEHAWSVLVRGHLRRLDEHEARVVGETVPSWVPMLRYDVLEVVPSAVTGRRFLIRR